MKTTWMLRTVVGALALAVACSVVAEPKHPKAKVTRIKGSARYRVSDTAEWKVLNVGQSLEAGATVQTAANSYVDLVLGAPDILAQVPQVGEYLTFTPLAEEDSLRVYEDTVLAVTKLTATGTGADEVKDTQLDLRAGKIFGKVKKLSAASKYEITLPTAVAGIQGTIYTISAQGVVAVLTGSVVIAYTAPDGSTVTQVVNAGWQFDITTGQLTPIPDYNRKEMVKAARQIGIGPNTPPTTFTVDHTVYHVSPTTGFNGAGGTQ